MRTRGRLSVGVVAVLLPMGAVPPGAAIPQVERAALVALYTSTHGENWTNRDGWLGRPGSECSWYGVTCVAGEVVGLKLERNNLAGPLPPELGDLTRLSALVLSNNRLSGSIPLQMGKLEECVMLGLSGNQLSGSIPPQLAKRALALLDLSRNQLSGSIPRELGNAMIMRLDLSSNRLSGPIPPELGWAGKLLALDLRNNELSGAIPPALGKLEKLAGLALSHNKLSGRIPPELANLKKLQKGNSDFRYNALWTDDSPLRDVLNATQAGGDWEATQTVAPTDVSVNPLAGDAIKVSWTPIRFQEFGGGYRVSFSTAIGGPYTLFGTTVDKKASALTVTGLAPGKTYYVVVQTMTHPHDFNRNTVISGYSKEVLATEKRQDYADWAARIAFVLPFVFRLF